MSKTPTVLYLDSDYHITLTTHHFDGVRMRVIPEVVASPERRYFKMPPHIEVLEDQALNPFIDDMSVYHPTPQILRKIRELTNGRGVDIVVIGNNRGAGRIKATQVARHLRSRSVIVANSVPESGYYIPLGYKRLAPRDHLHEHLLELFNLV